MFGVSNTYSPAIWMSRVMILVLLMVKRNPVNSPSWGEGMFIMAYPKVIPLFYMGFLYIPGGCLGFLPSTDRIKLLNTWHLSKLTIKRNIFFRQKPTWGYVIRNVGNRWGSKTLRLFVKRRSSHPFRMGVLVMRCFGPWDFWGRPNSQRFLPIRSENI